MTSTHLSEIRSHLQAQLEELTKTANISLDVEHCADDNEFASQITEAHFKVALNERASAMIREIQGALKKIDAADYGYCEHCGGEIGVRRLLARPTATFCVDCQAELEAAAARGF